MLMLFFNNREEDCLQPKTTCSRGNVSSPGSINFHIIIKFFAEKNEVLKPTKNRFVYRPIKCSSCFVFVLFN